MGEFFIYKKIILCVFIGTSQSIKDMLYQKYFKFFKFGFQAWEQSAGVIVFPSVQLLASEVSKLLTKEIKRTLNGKSAGNDRVAHSLGVCCHLPVFYAAWYA